jgi:ArsR family transcriptional regulator
MKLSDEMLMQIAKRFAAMGEPTRLKILQMLLQGRSTVGGLSSKLGVAQPSVTKHLAVLREAGLVELEREGISVWASVAEPSLGELCQLVCQGVSRHVRREQKRLAVVLGGSDGRNGNKRK